MSGRSHSLTWGFGLGILVLSNLVALAGVAYNRMGEPDATVLLSERELGLPYYWGPKGGNSGVSLRLIWRSLPDKELDRPYLGAYSQQPGWLDRAKLTELGFDLSAVDRVPERRMYQLLGQSREVWLVLENDGPAYQAMLARAVAQYEKQQQLAEQNPEDQAAALRLQQAEKRLQQERQSASRLFVIDAGLDAARLRSRYPDRKRYLILRGRVLPFLQSSELDSRQVRGHVVGLSVSQVHVPLEYRTVFTDLDAKPRPGSGGLPRYDVTLAYGQRHEPWVKAALSR